MKDHPAESQHELTPGIVTRVYPDTWEVDVRPLYATSGTVRRAKVIGHYLPEVHTEERQSKVIYGRLDATQQAPVAIPIHNTMIPDADKPNYVHWLQLLGFRITINRTGVLEIRHSSDDETLLSLRIHDDNLTVDAQGDVTINCANAKVVAEGNVGIEAGGDISAEAGGNITVTAGGSATVTAVAAASVSSTGPMTVTAGSTASITAVGAVTITGATVAIN